MTEEQENLVLSNIKLVYHIYRTYYKKCNPNMVKELLSEGNVALCLAAIYYKKDKQVNFSSYAGKCIHNAMRTYIAKNKYLFKEETAGLNPISEDEEDTDTLLKLYQADIIETELEGILKTLQPRHQYIIKAIYFEDKTIKDLSTKLNLSRASIHKHKAEALRSIRKHLSK